jgi:hypothetical protein
MPGWTYRIIRELLTELANGCEVLHVGSADIISARKRIVGSLECIRVAKRIVCGVERLGLDGAFDEFGPVPRKRFDEQGHAEYGEDALRRHSVKQMLREKLEARVEPCRRYRRGVLWRPQEYGVIAQRPADAGQHDVKRWGGKGRRRGPNSQPKRFVRHRHRRPDASDGWTSHVTLRWFRFLLPPRADIRLVCKVAPR